MKKNYFPYCYIEIIARLKILFSYFEMRNFTYY